MDLVPLAHEDGGDHEDIWARLLKTNDIVS